MNHLTDETLNEYLDHELADRASAETHLAVCADCAARLAALQALFAELDSLPEEALSRDLAARITPRPSLPAALPRWLTLTATLQAALVVIAIIAAAPFAVDLVSPYLVTVQMPSLTEIVVQFQSQWTTWLDMLSTFRFPAMPQLPPLEISSLMLMIMLAGVSILWLVGNGLLLRKQA
ncbi:MAG: zf-HC2 domain-containing protein [Chloroflexi bacterium]|nr:zf-HC2 domain-containing protein [Chloroflexota bacterium]